MSPPASLWAQVAPAGGEGRLGASSPSCKAGTPWKGSGAAAWFCAVFLLQQRLCEGAWSARQRPGPPRPLQRAWDGAPRARACTDDAGDHSSLRSASQHGAVHHGLLPTQVPASRTTRPRPTPSASVTLSPPPNWHPPPSRVDLRNPPMRRGPHTVPGRQGPLPWAFL